MDQRRGLFITIESSKLQKLKEPSEILFNAEEFLRFPLSFLSFLLSSWQGFYLETVAERLMTPLGDGASRNHKKQAGCKYIFLSHRLILKWMTVEVLFHQE